MVDLNADLGESFGPWTLGDDEAMLGVVTSANVACGFHAGDPLTLSRTCTAAVDAGVAIGAQVGYRDLAGFGRRFVDIAPDELVADLQYQLGALDGLARIAGDRVLYVKPHGALYNAIVTHEEQAAAVVRAVAEYNDKLPVLGLPGSAFLAKAEQAGLHGVPEAFADRAYNADGTLVSRRLDGAVLHDEDEIAARVVTMATKGTVLAIDGTEIAVGARSICVHGDTPGAVGIARAVRAALTSAGVAIEAFAG